MSRAYERIVEALQAHGSEQHGRNWTCPCHEDTRPSLTVDDCGDRVLVHCKAGCCTPDVCAALGLTLNDLFDEQRGCTLDLYSEAKRLPVEFLRAQGLKDQKYQGAPSIRIPYLDATGKEQAVRYRVSLNGDSKFRWKTGAHVSLYGVWRLANAREAGYVVLCEGESDAQTLWLHSVPALGLPGAALWNEERDAALLDGIDLIYVVVEPDRGGEAVVNWIGRSSIRDRVRLVTLDRKDVSESYCFDPETFRARFESALESATPWIEFAAVRTSELEKKAWDACSDLATEERILDRFLEDARRCGLVGEERQAKILYLAITSRQFDRPVSVVVKGASSGGKSFVADVTLDFFPASSYYALSAMSERALAYSEEPLAHRYLVLFEAAALESEFASYLVRSLLSEGCVRYETVEKTEEGIRPRLIERPGPTGLLVTTTAVQLHPENETRMLSIPITDTPEQTKAIFRALAEQPDDVPDLAEWHELQRWIDCRDSRVHIPFAPALAELIPPIAVRLRRDVRTLLNLIAAHALLHQANRERDDQGRIIATIEDYSVVRDLVAEFMSEGVTASVSQATRETVEVVAEHQQAPAAPDAESTRYQRISVDFSGAEGMSATQIAKELGIDVSAAHRRVAVAVKAGYLKNLETRPRRKGRYVIDNPLPEETVILPTADDVVCTFTRLSDPIKHTNSSPEGHDKRQ